MSHKMKYLAKTKIRINYIGESVRIYAREVKHRTYNTLQLVERDREIYL